MIESPIPSESFPAAGLLEKIRMRMNTLPAAEHRVARFVLENPTAVMESSVNKLGAVTDTSLGTVIRFCQRFGFHGYLDFKLNLVRATTAAGPPRAVEVDPHDDTDTAVRKVLRSSGEALESSAESIDTSAVGAIVDALMTSRRIVFAASGASSFLASDFAFRLSWLAIEVSFSSDAIAQHLAASHLGPGDLCFAVSHTGATVQTLSVVRAAADRGATTAAVTSFLNSPLAELVDHCVVAGSRETAFRVEAVTSRSVHLAILDAIGVELVRRDEELRRALDASCDIFAQHRI
ncbi:MurR/RpiR family transcriptional regulator [Rhodococcus globerulus]|uniref:MurR/RpiR family transcriptional regulator n=1 Tax=Rhodococcus globerulus TaxID=33008 RepID=UPI003016DEB0